MTPVMEPIDAHAVSRSADRRSTQRRRVLKGATLSFNRGFSAFECAVRN